jgi:hypothetical protein
MTRVVLAICFILSASLVNAQTLTVTYDYGLSGAETLTMVQGWVPTLYVNGTPFTASHTCVAQPAPATAVTCTFPLPNVSSAITASGNQTFEVSLKDPIVGEGGKSSPFIRVKPHAPTNARTP